MTEQQQQSAVRYERDSQGIVTLLVKAGAEGPVSAAGAVIEGPSAAIAEAPASAVAGAGAAVTANPTPAVITLFARPITHKR